jgi:hypothetical protein
MTTLDTRGELDREEEPGPREPRRALFARFSPRTRDVLSLGILVAALALPFRALLTTPGPPMEEGFMLVFPARVLAGAVPNVDFLHLYGPGGLWVLAGIYKLFGGTLFVERMFGLAQIAGVVFGIYFLARPWGRVVAVVSGLVSIIIILPPLGLAALAWTGAVALGLLGTLAALGSRHASGERRARVLAIVAGVLYGIALLYRIDLIVAIGLAIGVVVWKAPRRRVVSLLVALVATTALYLVQVAMAGFHDAFNGMVLDPLFHLRGGRHLPIPPAWSHYQSYLQIIGDTKLLPWPLPTLAGPHQLFLFFFALVGAIAFLVAVAVRSMRRHPGSPRSRGLLAVALFGLGILPQALQRPDSTHIAWVGCVSISFLPVAAFELLGDPPRWLGAARRLPTAWTRVVACALPVVMFGLIIPNFTVQRYADFAVQTFGYHRSSYGVSNDGRTFYNGNPDVAAAGQQAVDEVARISKPGQRLFVGTGDLRKTPYSEAWIYYLFPDLVPGTYYIEMDPGIANAKGSRLASDLKSSDIAVLSTVWDPWAEPNDSLKFGSDVPNQVLHKDFCLKGDYAGYYRVYVRCTK